MKKLCLTVFAFMILLSACQPGPQIPITGKRKEPTPPPANSIYLPVISNTSSPVPQPTQPPSPPPNVQGWSMAAGNSERTSWTSEEVTGTMRVEWYRPIEAYIPQNVQLIASDGLIFVSTSRGLYALYAEGGQIAWRFDTEMPLGNSPTVSNGIVYVGGFDRKLHALRASDGTYLWSFDGAQAGYSTNPLVVEGLVIVGNRDGAMYAVGANGTARQGQLVWKYQTDGLIDLSAAYKDGVVYFAANDNFAYALRASNGALVWKSDKLPGDGYQSYWPVIFQDKVIFAAASGYRTGLTPGTSTIKDASNNQYGKIFDMERDAIFQNMPDGSLFGSTVPNQSWANGKTVLNGSRLTEYLEDDPDANDLLHKPWRRVLIVLNRSDGSEYTFDSDGDGNPEYIPALMWGTHSGNRFPPIVGPDGILYFSNILQKFNIPQGRVMGWLPGTPYLSQIGGQGAVDEPQALSMGGTTIYRTICCDRVGDYFSINSSRTGSLWGYSNPLSTMLPGYDQMWYGVIPGDTIRLQGNYGTQNGIYHNHGDQNPLIPYNGHLFVHRSNAVIAFGPGPGPGSLPLLNINSVTDRAVVPSESDLIQKLEAEVWKIVEAGHLRPGYYNAGQFSVYSNLASYFENPGDTLYALARAYPYLSTELKAQVRLMLEDEFRMYFDTAMVARIGWADGAPREAAPLPNDVEAALASMGPTPSSDSRSSWSYPPHNFYALWKYVQIVPEDTARAYDLAKSKIQVPVPALATNDLLMQRPFEHNAYIAGYYGFLQLQELAGKSAQDSTLRTQVTNELNRLMILRTNQFSKDTYWVDGTGSYHLRTLNVARNFIFLTPELGETLRQNNLAEVQAALQEYNDTAPFWFAARTNAAINEGARQNLYDYHALFLARAFILKENQADLVKYLDVPAFERGDLFYLQNLVAAIEAP